jgi:hypothetical protein
MTLECGHQCPSICGEICPDKKYCQQCADAAIQNLAIDYIGGSTYDEVDLDEQPCIIPSCGHIMTLESMDGHMDMAKYYTLSEDADAACKISGLTSSSVPFSAADLKNCPICRSPLRNINRYGRIVRRAWIDEATKKFIVWANSRFFPLTQRLDHEEARLGEITDDNFTPEGPTYNTPSGQGDMTRALEQLSLKPILLTGTRDAQIKAISKVVKKDIRYRDILKLRADIASFLREVDEAEQPVSRIHDLVQDARRNRVYSKSLEGIDLPSVLEVRNRILATALLIRCDYSILLAFLTRPSGLTVSSGANPRDIRLSLANNRQDCDSLINESHTRNQPANEVEGLIYWALFAAVEHQHSASTTADSNDALITRAQTKLRLARILTTANPGQTRGLPASIDSAERRLLHPPVFYTTVTSAEKSAVYAAMAREFRGTGHWYYCVNGHPFTIGECGMPMQRGSCPQCGAVVGGMAHHAEAGVTRAEDLEAGETRRAG